MFCEIYLKTYRIGWTWNVACVLRVEISETRPCLGRIFQCRWFWDGNRPLAPDMSQATSFSLIAMTGGSEKIGEIDNKKYQVDELECFEIAKHT